MDPQDRRRADLDGRRMGAPQGRRPRSDTARLGENRTMPRCRAGRLSRTRGFRRDPSPPLPGDVVEVKVEGVILPVFIQKHYIGEHHFGGPDSTIESELRFTFPNESAAADLVVRRCPDPKEMTRGRLDVGPLAAGASAPWSLVGEDDLCARHLTCAHRHRWPAGPSLRLPRRLGEHRAVSQTTLEDRPRGDCPDVRDDLAGDPEQVCGADRALRRHGRLGRRAFASPGDSRGPNVVRTRRHQRRFSRGEARSPGIARRFSSGSCAASASSQRLRSCAAVARSSRRSRCAQQMDTWVVLARPRVRNREMDRPPSAARRERLPCRRQGVHLDDARGRSALRAVSRDRSGRRPLRTVRRRILSLNRLSTPRGGSIRAAPVRVLRDCGRCLVASGAKSRTRGGPERGKELLQTRGAWRLIETLPRRRQQGPADVNGIGRVRQ